MAPALTEPLSPTEKLSSSTLTASPSTRSSSAKVSGAAVSTKASIVAAEIIAKKDKKKSITSVTPSTSKRLTRFKVAVFHSSEKGIARTAPLTNKSQTRNNINKYEQMGLSAAPNLNNNNNKTVNNRKSIRNNNNSNNNNNNKVLNSDTNSAKTSCRDNSPTNQILADLKNEAISADICLRQQLLDGNLVKSVSNSSNTSDSKDILVIKDGSIGVPKGILQKHMESETKEKETKNNKIKLHQLPSVQTESEEKDQPVDNEKDQENQNIKNEDELQQSEDFLQIISTDENTDNVKSLPGEHLTSLQSDKNDSSPLKILSIEELPPVSTDSTMTASEVEDNLEERLSQLDGTAIMTNDDTNTFNESLTTASVTPQHTTQEHQQEQLLQLQQQLQQSPPVPHFQQVPPTQNNFNVQNTNSSTGNFNKEAAGAGELEDQDIEEVLKVLKGFDPNSGSDALCDLNVLFNEVYTTLNYDELASQTTASTTKVSPLKEMQLEVDKKQQTMQRKVDFLLRRMRKIQARYISKHASEEIAGLFELSARVTNKGSRTQDDSEQNDSDQTTPTLTAEGRPHPCTWSDDKKCPVSATQMYATLHKLETAANSQQLCTSSRLNSGSHTITPLKKSKKSQDAAHGLAVASDEQKFEKIVPTFDDNVVQEITHIAGLLKAEVRQVQNAIDSDATESSSGAESADEMVIYSNSIQQPLGIAKRAAWRYSQDRAAIASRWAWLLSQIADLEIKIRQHSELRQEIMRTKSVLPNSEQSSKNNEITTSSSVNGFKGNLNVLATSTNENTMQKDENGELEGSCRTRGYQPELFRKRKLIQTTNIHAISKKAARPSTIKCGCQWPLQPCTLCTGRVDPTAPRDLPDTMMMPDRVALLDPGFHPVLSFPEDINNAIHFEAIARSPEWQQRLMRCQVKNIAKSIWKAEREAAVGHSKKYGDPSIKRKYIKKKDRIAEEKSTTSTTGNVEGRLELTNEVGMGTGSTTTSTTTPLVANKLTKNPKKMFSQQTKEGTTLEPLSPVPTNNSSHSQQSNHSINSNSQYIHQTSDYPLQNYGQYNPNQAHSSLISNSKNNKYRKTSSSTTNFLYHTNNNSQQNHPHYNNHQHFHHNSNSHYNTNGNTEMNFLHTNDNWDSSIAGRSRTSSPTHGGSSNYHKYERSLDRKNRSSYDIDNIVIPYSVAATTRVEILPYKEIPTPKWRLIENEKNNETSSSIKNLESSENVKKMEIEEEEEEEIHEEESNITTISSVNENNLKGNRESSNDEVVPHSIADEVKRENNLIDDTLNTSSVNIIKPNNIMKNLIEHKISQDDHKPPTKVITESIENDSLDEPVTKKLKTDKSVEECETDIILKAVSSNKLNDLHEQRLEEFSYAASLEEMEEDISDEAMKMRHERALTEERRKFQTYLKFPWSTRSRANRRIDSRAESSGANTPDPMSPAPHTPSIGAGDQESIPSPLAPSTPSNPLDSISEGNENVASGQTTLSTSGPFNYLQKRYERRRTTSTKKDRESDRRSTTPDPKELIPPYEALKFPLTEEIYENMLNVMSGDQDDSKCIEDHNKLPSRSRNNYKNDFFLKRNSKTAITFFDGINSNRRLKFNNKTQKPTNNDYASGQDGITGSTAYVTVNGKDEEGMDEEEDDYPKHHLVPDDDLYHNNEYATYVDNNLIDDSESEFSEIEPFADDDPNDPEWKGESGERSEKTRRKY